tara:strand:+ start:86 stop:307 length:222 start_codon:yes stop_codon:yes gene_type:complete
MEAFFEWSCSFSLSIGHKSMDEVLKSHTNFSSAQAVVVLGVVACILFFICVMQDTSGISSKEKGGILLITAES